MQQRKKERSGGRFFSRRSRGEGWFLSPAQPHICFCHSWPGWLHFRSDVTKDRKYFKNPNLSPKEVYDQNDKMCPDFYFRQIPNLEIVEQASIMPLLLILQGGRPSFGGIASWSWRSNPWTLSPTTWYLSSSHFHSNSKVLKRNQ